MSTKLQKVPERRQGEISTETLRELAESDLPCRWIAAALIDIDGRGDSRK